MLVQESSGIKRLRLAHRSPVLQWRFILSWGMTTIGCPGGLEQRREISVTVVKRRLVSARTTVLLRSCHEWICKIRLSRRV